MLQLVRAQEIPPKKVSDARSFTCHILSANHFERD